MIDKKTRDPIIKMELNMLVAEYSYEEDIRVKQEEASHDRKRCCSTKEFNHRRIPRKTERVSNHLMA